MSLVEKDTTVGGTLLPAGSFLLVEGAAASRKEIHLYTPTDVGASTSGTLTVLIDGVEAGLGNAFDGIELIEDPTLIGGTPLSAGHILVSQDGDASISYLTVTGTAPGTSAATATLLLDGAAVGLNAAGGDTFSLTLVPSSAQVNQPPTLDLDVDNSSGATGNNYQFSFTEGGLATAIADSDVDVADVDSTDFYNVTLAVSGLLDGNAEELVLDGSTFALATAADQDTGLGNYHVVVTTGIGTADVIITKAGGGPFTEVETEALISAIQYRHADGDSPTDGDRIIDVTVNDGIDDSLAARTTINVNPENDGPTLSSAVSYGVNEDDGYRPFGMLGVADPDSGTNSISLTLSVSNGIIDLDTKTGLTLAGGAYGTDTFTVTGTVSDLDTALGSFKYQPTTNFNGTDTLNLFVDDLGNTGSGGSKTDSRSANITVTAVNDAPVLDDSGPAALTAIYENETNNSGNLVSFIIASAGANPSTDVDIGAVEGIAVISVDDANGTWEYSTNDGVSWSPFGAVTDTSAVVLGDSANDRIRFVPDANYNGTALIVYRAWDRTDGNPSGTTGVDASVVGNASPFSAVSETASITVTPVEMVLHLATAADVSGSGTPGLTDWSSSELLGFGDPNIAFEPGTSDGTFSSLLDLDTYASAAVSIDSVHVVSSNITVGGGGNTVSLQSGDVLFSHTGNAVTFTGLDSVAVSASKTDVVRFRPSDETFEMVLDNVLNPSVGGLTLVEKNTTVGDSDLTAGSFLLNTGNDNDILYLEPTGAGQGVATGTPVLLTSGNDIGMGSGSNDLDGMDLVEDDISPGGTTLTSGQILLTLDLDDSTIGSNNLAALANDIFYLDVSTTTMGITGTTTATAALFLEGADVNLDTPEELASALSFDIVYGVQSVDPAISLPGSVVTYTENGPPVIIDGTASLVDPDTTDFDTGQLRVGFAVGGTADDRLAVRHDGTGAGQVGVVGNTVSYEGIDIGTITGGVGTVPLVVTFNASADVTAVQAVMQNITFENVSDNPSTVPRTVRFALTDGDGGASNVLTETINVEAVNDGPVVGAPGAALTATEQVGLAIHNTGFTVSDPDESGVGATATLSVGEGTLSVVVGDSGVSISSGNGTGTVILTGAISQIDNLLTGSSTGTITYLNSSDAPSASTTPTYGLGGGADDGFFTIDPITGVLSFSAAPDFENPLDADTDNVYEVIVTATDGTDTDTQAISVTVDNVNDPPVNTVPGLQSTNEDTSLVFSGGTGNPISIDDPDAGANLVDVTLTVTNGTVTLDGLATALGTETTLNTSPPLDPNTQEFSTFSARQTVAMDADGDYIVVWQSDEGTGLDVYGRLFDSTGAVQGPEFRVNTTVGDDQQRPVAAMDNDGNFVVVWESYLQDGDSWGVYARRYDVSGTALSGEIQVNTPTSEYQRRPTIAMDDAGNFVVVWADGDGTTAGWDIYGQRFDASGNKLGGEFIVNTTVTDGQLRPTAAMDRTGNFVITWQSRGQDADDYAVIGRLYDATGAAVTGEFIVNTTETRRQWRPAVAMAESGDFVIAWESDQTATDDWGIFARRYDASGTAIGNEFQVHTNSTNDQQTASIGMAADGEFIITWQSDHPALGDWGVYGQQFAADGSVIGGETMFSTTATGAQENPSVVMDDGGAFMVVWSGEGVDDSAGVHGQLYTRLQNISFTTGNGTDDTTVVLTGTIADINTALDGMIFTPDLGFSGLATVEIDVNDQGHTGSGGQLSDTDTVNIQVNAVNDAPIVDGPSTPLTATEQIDLAIHGSGFGVKDADEAGSGAIATLSVGEGILTVTPGDSGVSVTSGNGTSSVSLSGTIAEINNMLTAAGSGTIFYNNPSDTPSASTTLTVTVNDQGNTGLDPGRTGTATTEECSASVVINVIAVNDPPDITSDGGGATAAVNVAENTTAVTDVNATDAEGDGITYGLGGGVDDGFFSINTTTGELSFTVAPDFENALDNDTNNVYEVIVTATDGTDTTTQAISVTVTNVNDNTPDITSNGGGATAAINVNENTTAVTTVVATDADGTTPTYSIAGGTDAARFAIDGVSGVLTFSTAPDYEVPTDSDFNNTYQVIVEASDGTNTDSQTITVTVDNVNDNTPDITSDGGGATAAINVNENTTAVTTVVATDADGTPPNYSIAGGTDAARFAIDGVSGALTFIAAPDYETPTDSDLNNTYQVIVEATDGTYTDSQTITVTVDNVNDNTPDITSNGGGATAAINVNENTTAVTTVVATDADGTTPTYSIAGGTDAARFAIDGVSGALTFIAAPDYEVPTDSDFNNTYQVIVEATDGTNTDSQTITVTVDNVNEPPAITSDGGGATAAINVNENTTAVTTVVATDPDGTTPTYSITGGTDAARFAIDGVSGALTFIAAPDYEVPTDSDFNNTYQVIVEATDGTNTDSQTITVTVDNVNDNTPDITSDGGGATAAINVNKNPTAVTTVVATDADGTTPTYSIAGGTDAARFAIDGVSGALTFIAAPDYEVPTDSDVNNTYQVIVEATDGTNTDSQTITVTVDNVNDNTPDITSDGGGATAAINVNENATAVTTVIATDADGTTPTYSIAGGTDAARFAIDGVSGALTFIAAPDFEAPTDSDFNNTYQVIVEATDGTNTDSQTITVTVDNVNDNTPDITSNGGGATAAINVNENTTAVTTVVATDADGTTPTYSIAGGTDAARFAIDGVSGALTFIAAPDYEAPTDSDLNNTYQVIVEATDGTHTDSQTITVTVDNVNDNTPDITSDGGGATAAINVNENTTAVTTVVATDADGTTPTYSIAGGTDAARFAIDGVSGALTFIAAPDYEAPTDSDFNNTYQVIVEATDGTNTDSQTITVTVDNVNEAPSGIPSITGTATQGQTLTADTSGISDPDGLGAFSYQWERSFDGGTTWNNVGAGASTYLLGAGDVGAIIRVQVSYIDGGGFAEGPLTSLATATVTNSNNPPSGTPAITGTATEDQTLTADTSGISDADGLGAFSYQWQRSTDGGATWANVGADAVNYVLGDADVGAIMRVQVRYTDGGGTAEGPLNSAATAIVANINDTPVGAPAITGVVAEDQTLTADTSGISDDDGLGAFNYRWQRSFDSGSTWTNVGANAGINLLGDGDVGAIMRVQVSYTDAHFTTEGPLSSAPTVAVANVNDAPAGVPTITGIVAEDQTLTADASGISDDDGLGAFNYQWQRSTDGGTT